ALRHIVDERRAGRTFRIEPLELVANRMRLVEDAILTAAEQLRIALVLHLEAPDGDAVDLLDAGRQLVAPRAVVGGARREDFDVSMTRQALRDVARVQLGAAVDGQAVSLNDNRELQPSIGLGSLGHCESGSEP